MIDKNEIIEIRILQLLDSEDKWWTIEEISKKLFISKATVQKYTALLKLRCTTYQEEKICIETSPSRGVFLHRIPTFAPQYIYTDVIKELLIFSILDTFFQQKSNLTLKIAMDNFSSVASVRRKYQAINLRFVELELELDITITKDGIKGDERQIRWFYSKFYWTIFKGTEWPFLNLPKNIVEQKLNSLQNLYNFRLSPETQEKVIYWLAVIWWRHILGYRIKSDSEITKYCYNHSSFSKFVSNISKVFPEASRKKEVTDEAQVQYLFYLISALPILEKSNHYNEQIYMSHQKGDTLIYQATQEWLLYYETIFGKINSLEMRRTLAYKLLRIHSYSYLFKPKPYIIFEAYRTEDKKYDSNFQKALIKLYDKMNDKFFVITKNRGYILEHYTYLIESLININHFEKEIRICLSFSEGNIYEQIVREKLYSHFGTTYNLTFVPYTMKKDILITDKIQIDDNAPYLSLHIDYKLTERHLHQIDAILQLVYSKE